MNVFSYRSVNVITTLGCSLLFLFAVLYLENYLALQPCYLCVTQRFFIVICGLFFAIAALHNSYGLPRKIYASMSSLCAMAGAFFAMKQLWLQGLEDDQVPSCGPPIDYLFDAFPMDEIISMLINGDGNCSEVQWQFLGLSIPAWALMSCITLLGAAIFQLIRTD